MSATSAIVSILVRISVGILGADNFKPPSTNNECLLKFVAILNSSF